MVLKTSELNAKLFGKTNKRRATTAFQAQAAAKEQTPFIELAIAGKKPVQFELIRIPADEIESSCYIFADNAREQSFLNEVALEDILTTLQHAGQQYPAVGRYTEQGIEVLDGSRRRMACMLAAQDFLIYVAKEIDYQQAKYLSDVANTHKPLSLYERGREMQASLKHGQVKDQKSLAMLYQCSEALVSAALKAADLPLELLQTYPNVGEVGRPTIVKLHKSYFALSEQARQRLLQQCQTHAKDIWQANQHKGLARLTKAVSAQIEEWIGQPSHVKATPSAVSLIENKLSYYRKGSQATIHIKQIEDEKLAQILDLLKQAVQEK